MKIFAIRDRLLDYYQAPMAFMRAPDLVSALARNINDPETNFEITQAPEHFEIWQLGEVDNDGNLIPKRELIANCSQLIRGSVWQKRITARTGTAGTNQGDSGTHHIAGNDRRAETGPVPSQAPQTPGTGQEKPQRPPGGTGLGTASPGQPDHDRSPETSSRTEEKMTPAVSD